VRRSAFPKRFCPLTSGNKHHRPAEPNTIRNITSAIMRQIIITNGSSAVEAIRAAGIEGELLSWDDVLHDGPVPGGLALETLSGIRADFLAGCGWGSIEEIQSRFRDRDRRFREALHACGNKSGELLFWFEHDLYDQLQILQVLSEVRETVASGGVIWLICHDHFVAESTSELLRSDFEHRERVTLDQVELAMRTWDAFRASSPEDLASLVATADFSSLPYLRAALIRWFQEFPDATDGLSRTERSILNHLRAGPMLGADLFRQMQKDEEARFMGDASFSMVLEGLMSDSRELIRIEGSMDIGNENPFNREYAITEFGASVLEHEDRATSGIPEKWMGGVELNHAAFWFWDRNQEQVVRDSSRL
jgi:hypothetical protein